MRGSFVQYLGLMNVVSNYNRSSSPHCFRNQNCSHETVALFCLMKNQPALALCVVGDFCFSLDVFGFLPRFPPGGFKTIRRSYC